ncbi:MAG: C39 family peptidase [Opitutaceae bacterium]|nr:C39 family peptidase [Opitutaceae bacterium]
MKIMLRHLARACLALAATIGFANSPGKPAVPLAQAKALALSVATEQLGAAALADARLYRDLAGQPAVWVFEYRTATDDTPLTVVAAANRALPPVVMHWRGRPWHADPEYLARARASMAAYHRADAKADWMDLRWEGAFDLWVPRRDAAEQVTFAAVRDRAELTRLDIARAEPHRVRTAGDAAAYVAAAWDAIDRAATRPPPPVLRSVAATPQFGFTRYIARVPYLNQGQTPDCGIVSMMDILLFHDANGFPNLVNEADLTGLRLRLRTLMEWTTDGTYADKQLSGTRSYVQERGVAGFNFAYHARNNYRGVTSTDMSFAAYTSEIDAGRPVQVNVQNYRQTNPTDDNYGGHATCGVGYFSGNVGGVTRTAWAIIHDNWKGSFTDPYQNPNEPYIDYSQVASLVKVVPPAAPTAPAAVTTVVIDAPTNGSTVSLGSAIAYRARVATAANVTVSSVSFRVGDTILRTTATPDASPAPTATSRSYSTTWSPDAAGTYRLMVTGVDSLNRGFQSEVSVTVSAVNAPPVVGWAAPQYDNLQLLANNPVDLSVAASDTDGSVTSVEFILLGSPATSLGRVTPSGGTFTTLRGVNFTGAGEATLRAIATDNRGATTSADRRVRIAAATAAGNDAFAGATTLAPGGEVVTTTTTRATRETGEPSHAGNAGGRSLWWRWTPGVAGTAVIATRGSSFDTLLAVYTGGAVGALTPVVSNDDDEDFATSYVRFATTAGATYLIAVDGFSGDSGDLVLTVLHSATASPNDAFAARATLTGATANVTASNIVATRETGEPVHGVPGARSLWWTWTAPDNGTLSLSTAGSTFDTVLGLYTGAAVNALTTIATNDDGAADYSSALSTPVARGTNYHIAVDGYEQANGRVRLALTFAAAGARPANDNFAARAALAGSPASATAVTAGASKETGEPNHAGSAGGASVWWTWTAPADGTVTLSTEGSTFDTVLAVYTGATFASLSLAGADDDGGDNATSRLSLAVRGGTAYHIAIDGYNRAVGSALLYLTFSGANAPGSPPRARLINVATRGLAGSGGSTMIAGFSITGASAKSVLIRAVGPTLRGFGVTNAIADPVLTLFRGEARLSSNDNWEANASTALIVEKSTQAGAFALAAGARDAVLLTTLSPGNYTAQVTAAPGTSDAGVALVEVYDVDVAADADTTGRRLINLSTRGQVGTGGDILIAGIVVTGPDSKRVLLRGIGPALAAFGVGGALTDPVITVVRGTATVATNDDWSQQAGAAEVAAAAQQTGAFALANGSRDAALITTLAPGAYTVQLAGFNNTTGVGLLEAYELP